MPRFKNPKPQQFATSEERALQNEKEKKNALPSTAAAADLDIEGEEKTQFKPSLSLSPLAQSENKESDGLIISSDRNDNEPENRNTENARAEKESEKDVVSDHLFDNTDKKNEAKNRFETASISYKKRRPATSNLNPNLLAWLHKRYVLRDNAKTSASQVIKHYEKEFKDSELYVPLQSYQVGQLLRRLFPGLQRCKITVNGKRVWVYKHLSLRSEAPSSTSGKMADEKDVLSLVAGDKHKEMPAGFPLTKIDFRFLKDQQRTMTSDSSFSNDAQKHVRNSAILYNLLYPHSTEPRSSASTFRKVNSKSMLLKTKPVQSRSPRDEAIVKWLKENYEYAEGYYVKSLNVLKKYNQGRQTEVRYLSQVGRIIKYVFPNARHLRRSLKGGKREWIYHNIRPKDHTEDDIWRGSKKNLSPPDPILQRDSRPSLVPISQFSVMQKSADVDYYNGKAAPHAIDESLSFLDRDNIVGKESAMTDSDSFRSEEGSVFHIGMKSASCTPSPASLQDLSSVFYKAENFDPDSMDNFVKDQRTWSPYQDSDNLTEPNTPEISQTSDEVGKKNGESLKKTALEAQISRLKCEKSDNNSSFPRGFLKPRVETHHDEADQAEDLRITDASKLSNVQSASPVLSEEIPSLKRKAVDQTDREKLEVDPKTSRQSSADHNYSYTNLIDNELRIKNYARANAQTAPMSSCSFNKSANINVGPIPLNFQRNRADENIIQWEDLSMCDAHRFGWTLTPTLNNEIPSNYIEWVLFEGQWLRDGQRVFRELKIYDDWSVSIHAIGKKVHPDELGGITDLSRTVKSVSKVFATLAGARSCRGLPALCLSDLCVHGVVVAKTEIWSSRESNCEELRHRAINCQVLYCGNEESCSKCYRVIRMHTHSNATLSGQNGYSSKESRLRSNNSL